MRTHDVETSEHPTAIAARAARDAWELEKIRLAKASLRDDKRQAKRTGRRLLDLRAKVVA